METTRERAVRLFKTIYDMPNHMMLYTWPPEMNEQFYKIKIPLSTAKTNNAEELVKWVTENVKHTFCMNGFTSWYFIDKDEAAHFKLLYG